MGSTGAGRSSRRSIRSNSFTRNSPETHLGSSVSRKATRAPDSRTAPLARSKRKPATRPNCAACAAVCELIRKRRARLQDNVLRRSQPTSSSRRKSTKAVLPFSRHGVNLDFTHPGKPMEKGHIESFNGRRRDECLNVNQFHSLDHARQLLDAWRLDYNHCRPHGSLGYLSPVEFVGRHHQNRILTCA